MKVKYGVLYECALSVCSIGGACTGMLYWMLYLDVVLEVSY